MGANCLPPPLTLPSVYFPPPFHRNRKMQSLGNVVQNSGEVTPGSPQACSKHRPPRNDSRELKSGFASEEDFLHARYQLLRSHFCFEPCAGVFSAGKFALLYISLRRDSIRGSRTAAAGWTPSRDPRVNSAYYNLIIASLRTLWRRFKN